MDALSHVLGTVRIQGAVFFDVECHAPWGFAVPALDDVAGALATTAERLLNFHLVTEGEAKVQLEDAPELSVQGGDLVVLPHGDAHTVTSGSPTSIVDSPMPIQELLTGRPSTIRLGGTGATTRIVCGFFGCDARADRLFLAGLPRVFKVGLRDGVAGEWLARTVQHLLGEAQAQRPGSAALLAKAAEALFVETMRRYAERLGEGDIGWLAGARDSIVGAALALMHGEPERAWSIEGLASEVGTSRSVLNARFVQLLGEPPLRYLGRFRLHSAAQRLETTDDTILEIAMAVGYQSEAAFNRAFKRELGRPPARYRSERRSRA